MYHSFFLHLLGHSAAKPIDDENNYKSDYPIVFTNNLGVPIDIIIEATGLTKLEIERL